MAMAMARRLFGLARFDATTQMRKKSQSQSGSKKIAKIEHLLETNSEGKNCLENYLENYLENCLEFPYTRKMWKS